MRGGGQKETKDVHVKDIGGNTRQYLHRRVAVMRSADQKPSLASSLWPRRGQGSIVMREEGKHRFKERGGDNHFTLL